MVTLEGGKYQLEHDETGFRALRYGEPWRDLTGDGLVLALAQRVEELEAAQEPPPVFASKAPSREELWMRAYVALARHPSASRDMAIGWADEGLAAFDARFPR